MPENTTEIDLNELCGFIEMNKVVPIIGFDLFNAVFKDKTEDLLTFFAETYNKKLCDEVRSERDVRNGYDLMNSVYHKLSSKQRTLFGKDISKIITEHRKKNELLPRSFEQLARIKNFRFYINATFFNSLELAVSTFKVAKPEPGGASTYDVVNYHPRITNDENKRIGDINYSSSEEDFRTTNFAKPTIYNLLGTHDLSEGEYVLTDVHYMELLVKLISNEKTRFSNLKAALKNSYLLFIGCDFPDWVLRFFLRFCVDEKMDSRDALEKNYLIEQLADEYSKAFLIGNYGITKYQLKPDQFIALLYKKLRERDPRNIENAFNNNHIFISYNHDDKDMAVAVNKQLTDNFIDTWFDTVLNDGDVLDPNIEKAIDNSCMFLAIVTTSANQDIKEKKYYRKEWNHAAGSKDPAAVCKVVTSDYNSHTFQGGVYNEKAKELFLNDGQILVKKELVSAPDYKLSQQFIDELKQIQYNAKISGL